MPQLALAQRPDEDEDDELDISQRPSSRDADLLGYRNSACREWLKRKIDGIITGFEEQATRSDNLDQWWRIYNCELDDNQFYNGNAEVYVPIIRDAVNARATRFSNQLCPQSGRYVDAASTDGHIPWEILGLINYYLRQTQFKTSVLKPLLITGDIEGQYNLYIDWDTIKRHLVSRETRPLEIDGMQGPPEMQGAEMLDIVEEEVDESRPAFEVLHDSDVLVLPATSDSIEAALAKGGSVTIVRRWSKDQYRDRVDDGTVEGWMLNDDDDVTRVSEDSVTGVRDLARILARILNIRTPSRHVLMFETWLYVPLDLSDKGLRYDKKGDRRLCRFWWNINREPEGLVRNPYWNDRCPLLSVPVHKIPGIFKGQSAIEALAPIQYEANDAANERADVDHYGSMPIIRRSPGQGNAPLILNLAAVWDAEPGSVEFMQFPDLSQRARARIMDAMMLIFQSLGVNPAMLPQSTGRQGQRRNQAEVAMEQSVDLLTVAEAVEVPDEHILTPAVEWVVDLDHQYRDRDKTVRAFGLMGVRAKMISVPPIQNRTRYNFMWVGADQAKQNVAMMQAGTAAINTVRGMAQELKQEGYELRLGPIVERLFSNIFGPELGVLSIVDQRHNMTIDPEIENQLMEEGHLVPTHPLDDGPQHLQAHQQAKLTSGDPHGTIAVHIQDHLAQMAAQQRAQLAQMAQGAPGMPGGGGPGVSGRPGGAPPPQPGAQPQQPRPMRGPPGMISPDQMPGGGAAVMPRRM